MGSSISLEEPEGPTAPPPDPPPASFPNLASLSESRRLKPRPPPPPQPPPLPQLSDDVVFLINKYAQEREHRQTDELLQWLDERRRLAVGWTLDDFCRIVGDPHFQAWTLRKYRAGEMRRWMEPLEKALFEWLFNYSETHDRVNIELSNKVKRIRTFDEAGVYRKRPADRMAALFGVLNRLCTDPKYGDLRSEWASSELQLKAKREPEPQRENRLARKVVDQFKTRNVHYPTYKTAPNAPGL